MESKILFFKMRKKEHFLRKPDMRERIRAKNLRIRIRIHIRYTPNFASPYPSVSVFFTTLDTGATQERAPLSVIFNVISLNP